MCSSDLLQNVEAEHDIDNWEELCVAVHAKFGKDKHHRALEALERCKQTGTVEQYFLNFEELRHKVLVHNNHYDEAFFVTKFISGLKTEIQKGIRLHKPRTVDAALSLAETQEQMLEEAREFSSSRYKYDYKSNFSRTGFPGKGLISSSPGDQKKQEHKSAGKSIWESKFQTLKAQRRARGECFKCGDKFHPGHKCNASVPLNLVEELMEIFQTSQQDEDTDQPEESSDSDIMHISACALAGTANKKSFRLQGMMGDKQILLLVDSGSGGNFISSAAVQLLGLQTATVKPVTVTVANGAQTTVNQAVNTVNWTCQKAQFCTDFRVFNLPHYDMILGMEWRIGRAHV